MKDYSELVAWLRDASEQTGTPNRYELAADAIEALQRDAARYRDALDKIALAARTVASLKTCGEVDTLRGIAKLAHATLHEPL